MPTYEYACKDCKEHVEVVQSFKDDALTTCPSCGGPLRKVFGSIGISFKGSGFYKTDSRKSESASSSSSSAPAEKSDKKATPEKSDKSEKAAPASTAASSSSDTGKKAAS